MSGSSERHEALREVSTHLEGLRSRGDEVIARFAGHLATRPEADRPSLRNFLRYLALRSEDLRPLQQRLERLGLSRLGRCEGHVLASLEAVSSTLAVLDGVAAPLLTADKIDADFELGPRTLAARTEELLGGRKGPRHVRIMVTLPSESAGDGALIDALLEAGADVLRINCAHDGAPTWAKMVAHIHAARARLGRPCRIMMDLAGPKLRTGEIAEPIELRVGDPVFVSRTPSPGRPARFDAERLELIPASVPCQLPRALDHAAVGHRVFFDDGKHEGRIERVEEGGVLVRLIHSQSKAIRLDADKGINLPDTHLELPALTTKDREDLAFVVRHADLVGYSFVQDAQDLRLLEDALAGRAERLGIILKIETARAFMALPSLLLEGVGRRPLGVMIARGDLAVEVGYERLAEVQEEILWLCEAAHVPVIWATQVLERLAKKGTPTRAEITDAAMSERAECVMLNKGPHMVEAVRLLDGILSRMEAHQHKKAPLFRRLAVASEVILGPGR